VFSQSLLSLDLIEDFLNFWDTSAQDSQDTDDSENPLAGNHNWVHGADYFRMDGSTSAQWRQAWAESFNEPSNER
jgi:transcriptional regulator ATRX